MLVKEVLSTFNCLFWNYSKLVFIDIKKRAAFIKRLSFLYQYVNHS